VGPRAGLDTEVTGKILSPLPRTIVQCQMAEAIKFKEDKTIIKNADGRQKEISTF
jgi:hypothetical protein